MADEFDKILAFTLQAEGGYVNDADDPGGETDNGITLDTWKKWLTQKGEKFRPLRSMTKDDEHQLYHDLFWSPFSLDRVDPAWEAFIFDAAVNLRFGAAVRLAQAALLLTGAYQGELDGAMSDATIAAMNAHPHAAIIATYARVGYHVARTKKKFVSGIIKNRLVKLKDLIIGYMSGPDDPKGPLRPLDTEQVVHGTSVTDAKGVQHIIFNKALKWLR